MSTEAIEATDREPETPEELAEAITNLARTAARLPAHFVDKRAAYHAQINAWITKREDILTLRELTE